MDGGSGSGTDVRGEVERRDGDNVSYITLGTENNATSAYGPGLEHQYPMMSTFWEQ